MRQVVQEKADIVTSFVLEDTFEAGRNLCLYPALPGQMTRRKCYAHVALSPLQNQTQKKDKINMSENPPEVQGMPESRRLKSLIITSLRENNPFLPSTEPSTLLLGNPQSS